jgi:hypothetical protein
MSTASAKEAFAPGSSGNCDNSQASAMVPIETSATVRQFRWPKGHGRRMVRVVILRPVCDICNEPPQNSGVNKAIRTREEKGVTRGEYRPPHHSVLN